ncbi:MAG TPA: hypothetical protein VNO21_19565, partial [Polyangiaceae bacterium]|nr:hypothetical protein [Polyangiaceae bacterium]
MRGAVAADIEFVTATVIDLDPVRPKNTSSTAAELERALDAARKAAALCEGEGLVRPRLMLSGNGAQLWFALPGEQSELARDVLERGLKAFEAKLRAAVETPEVKVDSIHDVARIIKVIGTVARKGTDDDPERPHRTSAALEDFERAPDPKLAEILRTAPPPPAPPTKSRRMALPVVTEGNGRPAPAPPPEPGSARANRTPEGEYDWRHPVEMCSPVQRLWDHGAKDRSLAIFNMIVFFTHKGLALSEITDLVQEYDRRGLGKLAGRDAVEYIKRAYEKVVAGAREDGTIAPPCHSLQRLEYCAVNREPAVRCEIYDTVFDIEAAIDAVPQDLPAIDLEYRIRPILDAVAHRAPTVHGIYLAKISERFAIGVRDLRKAMPREPQTEGPRAHAGPARSESGDEPPSGAQPPAIEGEIYEDVSSYYVRTADGEVTISSFVIRPTKRIITEETEYICGTVTTDTGRGGVEVRWPLAAFRSKRDLVSHLPNADLQWTGTDNNVQGLLRLLAREDVPHLRGVTMLGEQVMGEERLWVGPDRVIGPAGFLDPAPVTYVPNGGSLHTKVRYRAADDASFRAVAEVVFRELPRMNTPEVVVPVVGWWFASAMKPRLMAKVGSFPILFLSGSPGSGKSSLVSNVMWPLFGVADAESYSATETEFALVKLLSSTRSIPIFIDEYK